MSNDRTVENYFSIEIKQFKDFLKLEKTVRLPYMFTRSRTIAGMRKILSEEEVEVVLNGKDCLMFLGGRRIPIETTPCNYGNIRYWFGCATCGRKTARLFLHGGAAATWKCRSCANLVYRSQQQTKGDFWTWYDKAQDIARELDAEYWEDGFSYLFTSSYSLFPDKPKNMHWKVYKKKRAKFITYVNKGNVLNAAGLEATVKKINKH